MHADLIDLLYLGPWLLLATALAVCGRWLGGRVPTVVAEPEADIRADAPVDAEASPLLRLAAAAAVAAFLLVLWALNDADPLSAVVLLAVLLVLLLHLRRRGILRDGAGP